MLGAPSDRSKVCMLSVNALCMVIKGLIYSLLFINSGIVLQCFYGECSYGNDDESMIYVSVLVHATVLK